VTFHVPQLQRLSSQAGPGPAIIASDPEGNTTVSAATVIARAAYKSVKVAADFAKRLSLSLPAGYAGNLSPLKVFFTSGEAPEDSGDYAVAFTPTENGMRVENNTESPFDVFGSVEDSQDPSASPSSTVPPHSNILLNTVDQLTGIMKLPGLASNIHVPNSWAGIVNMAIDNLIF